jgi:hypothetical protein
MLLVCGGLVTCLEAGAMWVRLPPWKGAPDRRPRFDSGPHTTPLSSLFPTVAFEDAEIIPSTFSAAEFPSVQPQDFPGS